MQLTSFLLLGFTASAFASPARSIPTIEVEYYTTKACSGKGDSITLSSKTKCANLKDAAVSFGVAGKTALPNGCTLKGFQAANCKSFEEQYIDGPAKVGKCDTGSSSGKVKSIQINCS